MGPPEFLIAVAAWIVLRRYRGPIVLAGLVIGSGAGAALAAWLGNKIGYAHYLDLVEHAPVETRKFRPLKVRACEAGLLYGFIPWVRGSLLHPGGAGLAVVYTGLCRLPHLAHPDLRLRPPRCSPATTTPITPFTPATRTATRTSRPPPTASPHPVPGRPAPSRVPVPGRRTPSPGLVPGQGSRGRVPWG